MIRSKGGRNGEAKFAPAGLKSRLRMLNDTFWDLRFNVDTFGYKPAVGARGSGDFQVHYSPSPYRKTFRILRRLEISADDVFLDIGCGLGRTVFAAIWLGARRAIGVDIDADLISRAARNLRRSRLKDRDVDFICMSAVDYAPDEATAIYMFHPFGPGTMQQVVEGFEASLARRPRPLRIAYENPVCASCLDASTFFHRIDEWPADKTAGSQYPTIFWASKTP